MAYALQRYYDPQRRAVICVHTDDWYNTKPHNDYWEKSRGEYNGYLTAMLYEALVWMEKLERLVYEDAKKAADYRRVAEEIRVQFNKPLDEGGFWSPESKTYFTGTRNLDIRYLPVQGSALKSGLVPRERAKALVASVEKDHAVFNLGFHVMNVRHMNDLTRPASQSNDCTMSMLGENGGWYGAPDADFYAGLPVYGDRGRLLWYINGMAEKFDITGFVGATTYMRDGVTPADYGWNSCMPDMAQPVWGLFTYGYGFQPDIGPAGDCAVSPSGDERHHRKIPLVPGRYRGAVSYPVRLYSYGFGAPAASGHPLPQPDARKDLCGADGRGTAGKDGGCRRECGCADGPSSGNLHAVRSGRGDPPG